MGISKIIKFVVLAFSILSCDCFAVVKMPRIFSNSMVLQQGENVNVWGWSDANAKIDVAFAGQKVSAVADKNGAWKLVLKPLKVSSQGREMTIFENDKLARTIKDILVGEVWVAGGQSNMAFPLAKSKGGKEIIASANNSLIRYFDQGSNPPLKSMNGLGKDPVEDAQKGCRWLVCSPKNAEHSFRAVPYIFARDVANKLNVPVGIVYTAIPGTSMIAWLPRNEYENNPAFAEAKNEFNSALKKYNFEKANAEFDKKVKSYPERVAKAKAQGKTPPPAWTVQENMRPWKDSPRRLSSPVLLYNVRIYPIKNFTARGIIWYQGEADSNFVNCFVPYFKGFVEVWRNEFNKPNMPFIFVQLPSYKTKTWQQIRLQQQQVADSLKNVYMATTIDTGDKNDIHPTDKTPVAKRLANLALENVYNCKDVHSHSPKFESVQYKGNSAIVKIKAQKKLVFKGEARGFEILVNGKWEKPNSVTLDGKTLVLSASANDVKISGVRYLYEPFAKPNVSIFDNTGLPLSPFLTQK